MAQFYDDFERANGALGNGWTTLSGSPAIVSGYVAGTVGALAYQSGISDAHRSYAKVTCGYSTDVCLPQGPVVRLATSGHAGYRANLLVSGGTYYFRLDKSNSSTYQNIASTAIAGAPPYIYTIEITWEDGEITATYNGSVTLTASDMQWAGANYSGISTVASSGRILDFLTTGGTAAALSVSPDIIGNFGECTELTFTGTGTTWTPGTPGAPTFTADHGTLSDQVVIDETHATATYCPGDYLGAVTFTDPSTGATDSAVVTSDPGIVTPPGASECPFDPDFIALANRTGDSHPVLGEIVTTSDVVTTSPTVLGVLDALAFLVHYVYFMAGGPPPEGAVDPAAELLKWVSGGYLREPAVDTAPSNTTLKQDMEATLAAFVELRGVPNWTLDDLLHLLWGTDDRNLTEVYDAIAGIGGGSNQDVLDRLDEIQGPGFYSLNYIVNQLQAIRTPSDYSLASVKEWIDALPRDWATHADTLAILGSIGGIALEVAAIAAAETEDMAASTAAAASSATVAAWILANGGVILDLLNQIKELLRPNDKPVLVPPIWPGKDLVTMDPPLDLATTTVIHGPMDGVLVSITSTEPGTAFFRYDGVTAWRNVGALSFYTDLGHAEPFQPLGFSEAIYVPKTMVRAGGVRIHPGHLPQGTVTPWRINA